MVDFSVAYKHIQVSVVAKSTHMDSFYFLLLNEITFLGSVACAVSDCTVPAHAITEHCIFTTCGWISSFVVGPYNVRVEGKLYCKRKEQQAKTHSSFDAV